MSLVTRTRLLAAAAVIAAIVPAGAQGRRAPDISGTSAQGDTVNLRDLQGRRNVLVVFYRTHG